MSLLQQLRNNEIIICIFPVDFLWLLTLGYTRLYWLNYIKVRGKTLIVNAKFAKVLINILF